MKALKIIGVIILILIVLFFVIALFLPSKLHMEESLVINKPASLVFKQVNNYSNWEKWSPWQETDPEMTITYEGPDLGAGASYSWISKVHGNGKMTIAESKPYESIINELQIMEGETANTNFYFTPTEGGTQVVWTLDIPKLSYPVERYFGLLMPGIMKKFFSSGLENLRELAESMPEPLDVAHTTVPETYALTVLDSCYWSEFESKIGSMYGEIMAFLARQKNVQMTGAPFTIYSKWDEANQFAVFQAAIPVDREVSGKDRVNFKIIPETNAVKGIHYGRYDEMMRVYLAIEEYIKEFGLEETCCPMEVYITDPTTEPDTSKWQTDIYFPVK